MKNAFQCIIAADDINDIREILTEMDLNFPCTILVGENTKQCDKYMEGLYHEESLF